MRKLWTVVAAVMVLVFLGVFGAAAQGPQGAGAEKVAQNSGVSRSYNPIKWMKKDPKATTEKSKKTNNKKEKSATTDTSAPPK
jgi:hypothetical protein